MRTNISGHVTRERPAAEHGADACAWRAIRWARFREISRNAVNFARAKSMNRILIATGLAGALCVAASTNAQVAEAPIPAQPPSATAVPQAVPYASQPAPSLPQPAARIQMPSPPASDKQQGATRPEPRPLRSRAHVKHRAPVSHVDRSAADSFTHQLNQRELESLDPGGGVPQAEAPRPPWRDAYPPE